MASSSVAVPPSSSKLEWKKMNKQELRDALASRGLDTNGLRPLLIQRLEASVKALAAAEALTAAEKTLKADPDASHKGTSSQTESQSTDASIQTMQENTLTQTKSQKVRNIQEPATLSGAGAEAHDANSKASAPKCDVFESRVAPSSAAENGKCELNALSDLEKKRLRAERFGVGLQVSEQEKLALRAERFAGVQAKKCTTQEPESEKRKQRAARFGIVDEETRKKARQERFAPVSKQVESLEDGKRKARAARFGAATEQLNSKKK